jgi:hypothetical protein
MLDNGMTVLYIQITNLSRNERAMVSSSQREHGNEQDDALLGQCVSEILRGYILYSLRE